MTVEQFRRFPVTIDFVRNPGDMDATPPEALPVSDLVITHKGNTWVIEIKVAYKGQSANQKAEEAIKQLSLYKSINVSLSVHRSPPVPVKKIIEYILKIRIFSVYLHVFVIRYRYGKEKIKIAGWHSYL